MRVSRILHAGYEFASGDTSILFDPIFETPFSRNCFPFPDVSFDAEKLRSQLFSAVFISHYHDDHCSFESLDLLKRETPIYLYCLHQEMFDMLKRLGFHHVHSLQIDVPVVLGDFEVIARRALDADVDSIFQIKTRGLNILNVVDSWIDPETLSQLAAQPAWDLVLWPFQTLREIEVLSPSRASRAPTLLPEEWIEQLKMLNPRIVVPSSCQFIHESWSWYNHSLFPVSYRRFADEMKEILPKTKVTRLNPSESVWIDTSEFEKSSSLDWVRPIGNQDLDYEYEPDRKIPSTSEVAKNFGLLTDAQTKTVSEYCLNGILDRYRSLESVEYFETPRLWHLAVFDHRGDEQVYFYRINGCNIEHSEAPDDPREVAWRTEIPIAKLLAAIDEGESLTSMYVRINDVKFAPEIERDLEGVELIDDPLVRCLFNGVFGSYQAAQLKRLVRI